MSIIYNGTTLSTVNTYQIYNGTNLTSINYNITNVWHIQGSVVIDVNGGSGTNGTYTQDTDTTIDLGTPIRSNYNFNGWSLSGSGSLSGTTYTFGTSTATITANWVSAKYTWSHGIYATFYSELKANKLNSVSYYTGSNAYATSSNYTSITGPNVLGDGTHSNIVYDVVYLSGTSAILCMHNYSNTNTYWNDAKTAASSYRSGGYLPSLAQLGTWYCNNSNITYNQTYSQLIKHTEGSGSNYYWWTSTYYANGDAYYIFYTGYIGTYFTSGYDRLGWVCAFSV